ncbi:MAG: caspase family protein, partial [Acidobacteriota bacterium]
MIKRLSKIACSLLLLAVALILTISLSSWSYAQSSASNDRNLTLQKSEEVKALPSESKRYALIIGIDQYQDTQIAPLTGAANDARLLADALINHAGFPQNQVMLLASDQPLERQPTRGNILRRLANLIGVLPKDGMLLVSFAGHGMERGGQAFLLPTDAQVSDNVRLLEETAISVTRLKEGIKETGVAQVLLILDACRNDPIGRSNSDNPLTKTFTNKLSFDVKNKEVKAFAILYATDVGHRAYEYKEKRQGYFTYELVEALKGKAANGKGEVTLGNLVNYLQEQVAKRVQLDLGKEQRPHAIVDGYKALELVISITINIGSNPSNNTTGSSTTDTTAIELAFWNSIRESKNLEDFRAYLRKYPEGNFAELAKNRLNILNSSTANTSGNTTSGNIKPNNTVYNNVEQAYQAGVNFLNQYRYQDAIEPLKRAIELKSDYAPAHLELGTSYYYLG